MKSPPEAGRLLRGDQSVSPKGELVSPRSVSPRRRRAVENENAESRILEASDTHPIFIVGPSRSGTSLVRHILNRHSRICITGETHYFDDLRPRLARRGSSTAETAELVAAEKYFHAIAGDDYRTRRAAEEGPITGEDLRRMAGTIGEGADAYFEAFCRLNAALEEKDRWGEKTPRHVFRIDDILALHPGAQIIAMIRDPRAVVVSYRDLHARLLESRERELLLAEDRKRVRKSYHVLLATLMWRAAVRASLKAVERHGVERVRTVRYEDLVRAPERSVKELATWLGVEYEPAMLGVNVVSSSHRLDREESGISTEPVDRWRSKLSVAEVAAIETCAGDLMRELGYERDSKGFPVRHVVPAWLTLPLGFVRAANANRKYTGNLLAYIVTRLRLAVGR